MTQIHTKMEDFVISQWNCRSAVANKENLENLLSTYKINIALLSETWFKTNKYINFSGYNIIRQDRPDGKGGVAILTKANITFQEVKLPYMLPECNQVAITLKLNDNISLTIVSIYVKPNSRISTQQWNIFFSSIPKPFLVGGDFNAHNMAWGCDLNDTLGKKLMDSLDENNLAYLNNGSITHLGNLNNRNSAIDLTICTSDIANIFRWSTISDPYGSDHLPILIKTDINCECITNSHIKKWFTKKANWDLYNTESSHHITLRNSQSYEQFVENLNNVAHISIPECKKKSPNSRFKGKSWWNDACEVAVTKRKESFQIYKSNPNFLNLMEYKKQDAIAKKTIKETKRKSWREYCSSLSKNTPMKEIWNKVNAYKNRKQKNNIPVDISQSQWVEEFHEHLTPPWVTPDPCSTIKSHDFTNNDRGTTFSQVDQKDTYLLNPFTPTELNTALRQHNNTSPGLDNIHYPMLSNLSLDSKMVLLHILNNIWLNNEDIPRDWNNYIIIPILKPNKPPEKWDSYRPISLASCVLKTYERLIKNRLEHWMEHNKLFPTTQYGFRRGNSTYDNVANLVTDIFLSFTKSNSVSAVFLDIQRAYDNVHFNLLVDKMSILGIPVQVINNICNLYCHRNIFIRINNNLIGPRTASFGLPQGSILSPILYIIYTYDLEKLVDPNIRLLQFADDVCIYTETRDINICNKRLHHALTEVNKWFSNNGLTISEKKSVVVTFTRKRFQPPPKITLDNYEFPYKTSIKFLGITLDRKLNWKEHIHDLVKRSENAINVLRTFCRHNWGSSPHVALLFYRTLVRPILDYGSIFYGSAANTHLRKIEQIKNRCLRICTGYLPSTPITAMEAETREPPLQLRRKYVADKFLLKLYSKESDIISKINQLAIYCYTSKYWNNKKIPLLVESYTYISRYSEEIYRSETLTNFAINYENYQEQVKTSFLRDYTNISQSHRNILFHEDIEEKWKDHEYIFTDGSKINSNIGCAVIYPTQNIILKYKLPENSSVFSAELLAIKEAFSLCAVSKKKTFCNFY